MCSIRDFLISRFRLPWEEASVSESETPRIFIKIHRLINFSLEDLKSQIKDAVTRRIKSEVTNAPDKHQLPVLQIERRIDDINDILKPRIAEDLKDFAVELKRLDISRISIDKESEGYQELRSVTADQQQATITAQTAVNIKNMSDLQAMNGPKSRRDNAHTARRGSTCTAASDRNPVYRCACA